MTEAIVTKKSKNPKAPKLFEPPRILWRLQLLRVIHRTCPTPKDEAATAPS